MKHDPELLFENCYLCIYKTRNYYGNFRLQSVAHGTVKSICRQPASWLFMYLVEGQQPWTWSSSDLRILSSKLWSYCSTCALCPKKEILFQIFGTSSKY